MAAESTKKEKKDVVVPATPAADKADKTEKKGKPEKPDEDAFRKARDQAEKEVKEAQEKLNAIKVKIDTALPKKDSPQTPNQQKAAALRKELNDIKNTQSSKKGSKTTILDQIKSLDNTLKSKLAELKTAKSRVQYKSASELDDEVSRLQKEVDGGRMKLVDEKRALAQISALRKQKKSFAEFETTNKQIDEIKAKIADLKKTLDDPEARALSDRFAEIQKELDVLKAEQDMAFKSLSSLRDERTQLQKLQREKYDALQAMKNNHYEAKKAYREWENEYYRAKKERQRTERESYEREKRRKIADEKLAEASNPAYTDEIMTCESLIAFFDPESEEAKGSKNKKPLLAKNEALQAQASRTVDASALKGTKLAKKGEDEEVFFVGGGGKKKGKKGKKEPAAAAAGEEEKPASGQSGKFQLSIGVLQELKKIDLDAPMGQADVPGVLEKLRKKLGYYKENQKRVTDENIAKAKKEIEKLEAEAAASSSTPASGSATPANGAVETPKAEKTEVEASA